MKVDYDDAKMPFPPGAYQVVNEDRMAELSSKGWFLVQVLEEQGQRPYTYHESWSCSKGHTNAGDNPRCSGYDQNGSCNSGRPPSPVVTLHRFLMRQGVNEAIVAANEETAKYDRLRRASEDELRRVKTEAETQAKALAESRKERDLWKAQAEGFLKDHQEARAGLRKLEGDLAKVRQAIGDMKWKEIVGG
jgi:hypothetical protein